jgi:hypothetical protein
MKFPQLNGGGVRREGRPTIQGIVRQTTRSGGWRCWASVFGRERAGVTR